jgi:hypothetical protein
VTLQCFGAFIAFGGAAVFGMSTLSKFHYGADIWIAASAFLVGLLFVTSILRTRIALDADGVEMSSLLGVRRMRRSDIVGYRIYKPGRNRPYLELRSRDPRASKLDIDMAVMDDFRCKPWFDGMPDLAARDFADAQAAIDNDAALGATVEERRTKAAQIKAMYLWMFGLGFGFLGFVWFYDQPNIWFYGLLLIYVVACLGLTFFGPPFLLFDRPPTTQEQPSRLGILNMLWMPAGSCLWGLEFIHLADANAWKSLLAGCAAAALVIFALAVGGMKIFRNDDWKVGILGAAAAGLCFYSLFVGFNAVADLNTPALERATIADMSVKKGRSTSYRLDLVFAHRKDRELVSEVLYNQLKIGGSVCLARRPGRFRIDWNQVERC